MIDLNSYKIKKLRHKYKNNVCVTCGVKKEVLPCYGVMYIRSGIITSYSPECIDWEEENNKTID